MSDRIKKPLSLPAVPPTKIAQGQQATGERDWKELFDAIQTVLEWGHDYRTRNNLGKDAPNCFHQLGIWAALVETRAQQPTNGAPDFVLPPQRSLTPAEAESLGKFYKKVYKPVVPTDGLNKCASELEGTLVAIESVSKLQSSSKAFEREVQGPASPTLREAVIQECCKILLDNGEHRAEWILLRALAAQASSDPLDTASDGGVSGDRIRELENALHKLRWKLGCASMISSNLSVQLLNIIEAALNSTTATATPDTAPMGAQRGEP